MPRRRPRAHRLVVDEPPPTCSSRSSGRVTWAGTCQNLPDTLRGEESHRLLAVEADSVPVQLRQGEDFSGTSSMLRSVSNVRMPDFWCWNRSARSKIRQCSAELTVNGGPWGPHVDTGRDNY